jgi:hypothetical protein
VQHGPEQAARAALNNSFLTEAQLLKTLSKQTLPAQTIAAVASHDKWPRLVQVKAALLRHPEISPAQVPALLPGLPRRDIEDLIGFTRLKENIRSQLQTELTRRKNEEALS